MRDIKFRAWDKHKNQMRYYEFLTGLPPNYTVMELMQYTGLKDKNGVEIYESDIVRWGEPLRYKAEVMYEGAMFAFEIGKYYYPIEEYSHMGFEVIGNIYNNPELLNK